MEEFLYSSIYEILILIIAVVFTYLGNLVRKAVVNYLNTDTKKELAKIAVYAVEQTFKALHGADKKNEAIKKLTTELNNKGIPYNDNEIDDLIEAAVLNFNNGLKNKVENTTTNEYVERVAAVLEGVEVK